MKVGIIGLGNLGSAIAHLVASNGHSVLAWEYNKNVIDDVNINHCNQQYLPGIDLTESVMATAEIDEVFSLSELIFVALPSRFIYQSLSEYAASNTTTPPIVNLAKGIDGNTGKTAIQLISELFPNSSIAMLAGPSLANELSMGVMTGVVAASDDNDLLIKIGLVLNGRKFAVTYSDDVIGVEMCGILKNIYALGMGIFQSREDTGLNFVGAYLTQAFSEIQRLGMSLGAKPESFLLLSGVGDLIATSLSHDSHNFRMGRHIGEGLTLQEIEEKMKILPEGYNTLLVALSIAKKNSIELPLAELLLNLINRELSVEVFYEKFSGSLKC